MQTILLVDDEMRMLDLLELFLKPQGYNCIKVKSGDEALTLLAKEEIHLVILDVMMPYMDGWQTCEAIRKRSSVPILMLTARTDKSDIVKGLNVGADDYLTKPFNDQELLARVNALLRRIANGKKDEKIIKCDDYELNSESYTLTFQDKHVALTMKEYKIIEALIKHPKRSYTREQLLLVAWDHDSYTEIRTVDSHIRNLRDKLKIAGFSTHEFLLTVWGIGYKWK
ncbi:response regulator transcription factor [Paenisporosarcina sp. TG20]|uniref:response regulator transcription factor n=1 Tax=Paenisporosarcina sp. TG20 TaxID=1211706 RepID=UPI00031F4056|nr:response regulator transcription factor [Paenisporosarcina sp. TG20]